MASAYPTPKAHFTVREHSEGVLIAMRQDDEGVALTPEEATHFIQCITEALHKGGHAFLPNGVGEWVGGGGAETVAVSAAKSLE